MMEVENAVMVEVENAVMVEVGDRGRPPGEPPDGSRTWASMVTGGGRGGQPRPESVVDEGFVKERMLLEFPDGEEGEPVITIDTAVLEAMNDLWKRCIIVKVLGRHVALPALFRKLRELWKPQGGMSVLDLPRQFFMIRFEKEEEYLAALSGGPWRIFGSLLMVQAWSPDFDPTCDEIVTTPVWVRLSNIPVNLYHETILLGIAKGLGKPVRVDAMTLNCERARFARICVEVNLMKPLKGSVRINGVRYFVSYEGLTPICAICGVYGHSASKCSKRPVEQATEKSVSGAFSSPPAEQRGNGGLDDGFTTVRRSNNKTNTSGKQNGGNGDVAGVSLDRNLREISNNTGMETNQMQNRFATLMEDGFSSDTISLNRDLNPDKENVVIDSQAGPPKSDVPASLEIRFASGEKTESRRKGPKEGRVPGPKGGAGNKNRSNKSNKPSQGLIFGPKGNDSTLSSSGKRLRVEEGTAGREGGNFASANVSDQCMRTSTFGTGDEEDGPRISDANNQNLGIVSHSSSLAFAEEERLA